MCSVVEGKQDKNLLKIKIFSTEEYFSKSKRFSEVSEKEHLDDYLKILKNYERFPKVFITAGIYLFKVINGNTGTMCEMC